MNSSRLTYDRHLQVSASRSSTARATVSMPLRTRTVARAEETTTTTTAPPALDLSPNTQAVSIRSRATEGVLQQCCTSATCAQ
jgi:hypothetical protein